MTCPHCGSTHAADALFCPLTGKTLDAAGIATPQSILKAEVPGEARRGGLEILSDSMRLYRNHAKVFLTAAALVLVPIYVVHAGLAVALLPASASSARLEARSERIQRRSAELQRESAAGTLTAAEAQRAQEEMLADAGESLRDVGGALAGIGLFIGSMLLLIPLFILGSFFGTAAVLPLALDRARGGSLDVAGAWRQVGARAVPLLVTGLLATLAVLAGLFLFVLPGLVLGFLFCFAAPVVMLSNESGVAALRRSARLVIANLIPTLTVLIALALLSLLAHLIGGLLMPAHFVFLHTLLQDAISLVVFPLPIIGLVLLYREAQNTVPGQRQQGFSQPATAHQAPGV